MLLYTCSVLCDVDGGSDILTSPVLTVALMSSTFCKYFIKEHILTTEDSFYNRPELNTHVDVKYVILFLLCVYFSYFIALVLSAYDLLSKI